ncbi:MAG: hypothetical protein ABSC37_09825 [Xanthobacteraceae bacterium]
MQRDAAAFRSFQQAQDQVWIIFDKCDNFVRLIFTDFTNRSIVENFLHAGWIAPISADFGQNAR